MSEPNEVDQCFARFVTATLAISIEQAHAINQYNESSAKCQIGIAHCSHLATEAERLKCLSEHLSPFVKCQDAAKKTYNAALLQIAKSYQEAVTNLNNCIAQNA